MDMRSMSLPTVTILAANLNTQGRVFWPYISCVLYRTVGLAATTNVDILAKTTCPKWRRQRHFVKLPVSIIAFKPSLKLRMRTSRDLGLSQAEKPIFMATCHHREQLFF